MARFLLLLALLCPLSVGAVERWQRPGYIVDSFIEVGLHDEYRPGAERLRKWIVPPRIWVDHQVGDAALQDRLINAHLDQLRNITGLPITRVQSAQQANFKVLMVPQHSLASQWRRYTGQRVPSDALCVSRIWTAPDAHIRRALVMIPVDRARQRGKLVSCIVEELTQSLGLPNDSDKVFPSVFNDHSTDQLLSGLDLVLLRLLYEPALHPGMTVAQVRRALRPLVAKLEANGVVRRAEHEVRKGALYRMLGYR